MVTTHPLRIIFMGTPDFAVPALRALDESAHEVVCVYTQPPRPKGRGHMLQSSPVHLYAQDHGIEVRTPRSLKNKDAQDEFIALNADIAIVAAYGLILPKPVLDAPRHGCLNIHASLLPRWRGASPIQRAIWAGDAQTGVTIMQMDEGLDTGGMIAAHAIAITGKTTASSLHDALCDIGGAMILETVNALAAGKTLPATPQDDAQSIYAPLLTKEDGRIDWHKNATEIDRQVRALNPWPGVWTETKSSERLKILEARPVSMPYPDYIGLLCGEGEAAGTLLDKKGLTLCGGRTVLQIIKIQPAGKKPMDIASALNGGYVTIGDVLA
ncbi:MAG: methionyl-tRNA formyltransferase [Alphaproteobacteria bacterium]|nr:methionyl-tRNA formyltransferase [Alphaproteobacteria bacterium]